MGPGTGGGGFEFYSPSIDVRGHGSFFRVPFHSVPDSSFFVESKLLFVNRILVVVVSCSRSLV